MVGMRVSSTRALGSLSRMLGAFLRGPAQPELLSSRSPFQSKLEDGPQLLQPCGLQPLELMTPDHWVRFTQERGRIPMEVGFAHNGDQVEMFIGAELESARLSESVIDCNVVEGVKLALLFNQEEVGSRKMRAGLDRLESNIDSVLRRMGFPRNVNLRLPYRSTIYSHKFESASDLLFLSLLYLFNLLKEDVRTRLGYNHDQVDFIFARKAVIAVSVPSCWSDDITDKYSRLWRGAGLKSNAVILAEAKSAAAFSAFQALRRAGNPYHSAASDSGERLAKLCSTIMFVADMGGATTDVAVVAFKASAHNSLPKLGELVDNIGSMEGAFSLVGYCRDFVDSKKAEYIKSLELGSGHDRQDVLNAICAGFEKRKTRYLPGDAMIISFRLDGLPGYVSDKPYDPRQSLTLTREEASQIWYPWTEGISLLLNQQVLAAGDTGKNYLYMEIALAGGGSFSKPLRARLENDRRTEYGFKIVTVEESNHSSVAEGNFLSLFVGDYRNQTFARASYGIINIVNIDSGSNLLQTFRAAATPGTPLSQMQRLEDCGTGHWQIQKGQKLAGSVLESTIFIGGDFHKDLVLEQRLICTEDSVLGANEGGFNLSKERGMGKIKSKLLFLPIGSIAKAGLALQGNQVNGFWAETQVKVYVKARESRIEFISVAPRGGVFPNGRDYSEPVPGEMPGSFFRETSSTLAPTAQATRVGDEDVQMKD